MRDVRKAVLGALLAALCFLPGCGMGAAGGKSWTDQARPLDLLNQQRIAALASTRDRLYVSTGERVFIVALSGSSVTDATGRISKQPADEITEILVDAAREQLWIVLNQNAHLASCYSYDLAARQCPRSFLEQRMGLYERLRESGLPSSISALAFDDRQAVFGLFRGGIYLYAMKEGKSSLVYRPSSSDHWPVAAILTDVAAFVATRGDGLIVVDRKTGTAARFPDKPGQQVRAVAVREPELYLGATGLYRARIVDFVSPPGA